MGGKFFSARSLWWIGGLLAWSSFSTSVPAADVWRARVSARLLSAFDARQSAQLLADVHYDCSVEAPVSSLTAAGLKVTARVRLGSYCVVEGWVSASDLAAVASISTVRRLATPLYALHPQPAHPQLRQSSAVPSASPAAAIDINGVSIMRTDQFVAQTGSGGAGAKVGVQSGGISYLKTIQGRGELPAVQVVKPADGTVSPAGDEGTALLEEIHAVAPSAALAYCGPTTYVEYTSCLSQLVGAGANVLVDDVIFPQQDLLSSDSDEVQAIDQLLTANPNVLMFTAAGNYNGSYWEGNYDPVSLASLGKPPLTCPSGSGSQTDNYVARFSGDPSQTLTVDQGSSYPLALAWADPPDHNASQFDLYLIPNNNTAATLCLAGGAISDNQLSQHLSLSAGTYTVYVATPDAKAGGKFLKLWFGGDGLTHISRSTAGSVLTPQAFSAKAITVGAVNGADGTGNQIESFSSLGPITLPLPQPTQIAAPVLVAPDGINVDAAGTYFAGSLFPDGNFYGTSAAAPNAAGVAALIRGAFQSLTASQVLQALTGGAVPLGSAPPDGTFGYGRIDAMGALARFPGPTITALPATAAVTAGTPSESFPIVVGGTGAVHFSLTSSNTSVIPSAVAAAGSPGVSVSPADCGSTTLNCTVTFLAANGPGGTVNLTLAALDGANRPATTTMSVTVTGNGAAPADSSPPPAATGGGGGGAMDAATLTACLLAALSGMHIRRRRTS